MTRKDGSRFSSRQIKDESLDSDSLGPNSVGTSEIIDGSVTASKISPGAIDTQHVSQDLINRLLPEGDLEGNIADALNNSRQPGSNNPFATLLDVKSPSHWWNQPFDSIAAFSVDADNTVRLDSRTHVPYIRISKNVISPLSIDHSAAINLESDPNHRHVTENHLKILNRLNNLEAPERAKAAPRPTRPVSQRFFISSLDNEAYYPIVHDEIYDVEYKRVVRLYKKSESTVLTLNLIPMGHGFFPHPSREGSYSTGVPKIDNASIYFNAKGEVEFLSSNPSVINPGLVGLGVSGLHNAQVALVEKQESSTLLQLSEPISDSNIPAFFTNLSVGGPDGWVAYSEKTSWKNRLDSVSGFSNLEVVVDGQDSSWIIGTDTNGQLKMSWHFPGSETAAKVNIQSVKASAAWIGRKFKLVTSACLIRPEPAPAQTSTRRLIVFAVTEEGERFILISDKLSDYFGDSGRKASKKSVIAVAFDHFVLPTGGYWSDFDDFDPQQAQVLVPSQGTIYAKAILLMCDGGKVRWISVQDNNVSTNSSTSHGAFGDTLGDGSAFKACAGPYSVEAIVRSADGTGGWIRKQMSLQTSGSLVSIPPSDRSNPYSRFNDFGFDKADICYVRQDNRVTGSDVIVYGTVFGENADALWLAVEALEPNESAQTLSGYTSKEIAMPNGGSSLVLAGGTKCRIFVSDLADKKTTYSWEAYLDHSLVGFFLDRREVLDGSIISFDESPVRVVSNITGNGAVTSSTTRQADGSLKHQEHDARLVVQDRLGHWTIYSSEPSVRMRRGGTPYSGLESSYIDFDQSVPSLMGARLSSLRDGTNSNEWFVIAGGSDGLNSKSNVYFSRRLSASPGENPLLLLDENIDIGKRAWHGQYSIACRTAYGPLTIPANTGFFFFYGGLSSGKIDKPSTWSLAPAELVRVMVTDLNETGSMVAGDLEGTVTQTESMVTSLPKMVNPAIFMVKSVSQFIMVFVDAPNVYYLYDGTPSTGFFGTSLPTESNVINVTPDSLVSLGSRGAMAFFQLLQGATDDSQICYNPDFQLSVPGKTTLLHYGGESSDDPERALRVLVVDPSSVENVSWDLVSVSGGSIPTPRADASLVWLGVWQSTGSINSITVPTRQLFYLYGGQFADGTKADDLWLLEYWTETGTEGLTHNARWTFLSSGKTYGIIPASSSLCGVRCPKVTSKAGSSPHGAWFFGGEGKPGIALSDATEVHLPVAMRNAADINLEQVAYDIGGCQLPSNSWISSEPIDIANVQDIGQPLDILVQDPDGDLAYMDEIRIGIAIDDPSNVYTVNDAGDWSLVAIEDFGTGFSSLADFQTGINITTASRGDQSWFPESAKKLYVILYFGCIETARRTVLARASFRTRLISSPTEIERMGWEEISSSENFTVTLSSSSGLVIENNSGVEAGPLMVTVTSPVHPDR